MGKGTEPKWLSVASIDPGGTTGFCWAMVRLKTLRKRGWLEALRDAVATRGKDVGCRFILTEIHGNMDVTGRLLPPALLSFDPEDDQVDQLMAWIVNVRGYTSRASARTQRQISAILIEDFILRESTMDRTLLAPVRITAKLTYALHSETLRGGEPIVMQTPSDAKGVITDKRLKRWDLFTLTSSPHCRDAIRHLCKYLREA